MKNDAASTPAPDPSEPTAEGLLSEHLPGLRAFLSRRAPAHVLQRESAADLAQSVCRDVLEHLADGRLELRGSAAFKQWLYEAAIWKLRARSRHLQSDKRDVGREISPSGESGRPRFEPRSSETPSRLLATAEGRERVRAAIASLGGRDARILTLAVLEERPHREIALELGISPAHSRVLLSRAIAALGRRLDD